MEEDVLGPRKTVVGPRYDTCSRCGHLMPRAQTRAEHISGEGPQSLQDLPQVSRPIEATMDGPPALLCATCEEEIAAGEPIDPVSPAKQP
jgi:hypothetical protein